MSQLRIEVKFAGPSEFFDPVAKMLRRERLDKVLETRHWRYEPPRR